MPYDKYINWHVNLQKKEKKEEKEKPYMCFLLFFSA